MWWKDASPANSHLFITAKQFHSPYKKQELITYVLEAFCWLQWMSGFWTRLNFIELHEARFIKWCDGFSCRFLLNFVFVFKVIRKSWIYKLQTHHLQCITKTLNNRQKYFVTQINTHYLSVFKPNTLPF